MKLKVMRIVTGRKQQPITISTPPSVSTMADEKPQNPGKQVDAERTHCLAEFFPLVDATGKFRPTVEHHHCSDAKTQKKQSNISILGKPGQDHGKVIGEEWMVTSGILADHERRVSHHEISTISDNSR